MLDSDNQKGHHHSASFLWGVMMAIVAWVLGVFGWLLAGVGVAGTFRPASFANERGDAPSRIRTIMAIGIGALFVMIGRAGGDGPGWVAAVIAFGLGLTPLIASPRASAASASDSSGAPTELDVLLADAEQMAMDEARVRASIGAGVDPVFEPFRQMPEGMRAVLPLTDLDEVTVALGDGPTTGVGRTVIIDYRDASGCDSRRQITVKYLVDYGDDHTIEAWCHHRRARRTFLLSRVETMYRPDTGEVIDRPLDFLTGMLNGPERQAIDRLVDDITVLVYVARSDGQMRAPERQSRRAAAGRLGRGLSVMAALFRRLRLRAGLDARHGTVEALALGQHVGDHRQLGFGADGLVSGHGLRREVLDVPAHAGVSRGWCSSGDDTIRGWRRKRLTARPSPEKSSNAPKSSATLILCHQRFTRIGRFGPFPRAGG
ncbi:MAG: hypothetical protein HQL41_05945 [Alphaproteobacteria bacterium]|nr:hypothetical protein [Alphaproteobacteria bacterium]